MSQYESTSSSSYGGAGAPRGARRKKVYDYLKAANELRQTYAAQWAAQLNGQGGPQQRDYGDAYYTGDAPGAFPDVEIARSGLEEMVIFPSYGRRIVRDDARARGGEARGAGDDEGDGNPLDVLQDAACRGE